MSAHQIVCFKIGKESFGVDIFAVREIVRVPEITEVPGTPHYVLGVINRRGRIVSVVDLGRRIGLGETRLSRTSRILVVHLEGVTLGFLVDEATAVTKLTEKASELPSELVLGIHGSHLLGVGKIGNHLVMLLNLRRLLSKDQAETAPAQISTPVAAL